MHVNLPVRVLSCPAAGVGGGPSGLAGTCTSLRNGSAGGKLNRGPGPGARPAASFAQARRQPGRARLRDPGSVGFSAASASPVSGDGAGRCSQGSGFRPGPAVDTGHAGGCRVESVASRAKLRLRAGSRREGGMP